MNFTIMLRGVCCFIMFLWNFGLLGQGFLVPADSLNKARVLAVSGSIAGSYTGVVVGLSKAWYSQYDRGKFHFYNDNAEWLQHDKVGHFWTAYVYTDYVTNVYRWTGLSERKAVLTGAAIAWTAQATVEVLDGFSEKWGASLGDIVANSIGVGLYVGQELWWQEQIFQPKFSVHRVDYGAYGAAVEQRAKDLYGSSFGELLLKDYNAQIYWVSFNPLLLSGQETKLPAWVQLSVGYGIKQVFGGYENEWLDGTTGELVVSDVERLRQFYFSFDIDLRRIGVKKRWAKVLLGALNVVKVPLPGLEIDSGGGVFFRPILW